MSKTSGKMAKSVKFEVDISKKTSKSLQYKSIKFRCENTLTQLQVLKSRGWTQVFNSNDWDLWWCDTKDVKLALESIKLNPRQKVSHFRNHGELTRKDYLYRNLKRYKRMLVNAGKVRESEFCDSMPTTFELPSEYRVFVEEHRRSVGAVWMIKPACGSQGRGIFLFQKLRDLKDWRKKDLLNVNYSNTTIDNNVVTPSPYTYIIQKYVDNPYLLEGRKFDMRIYVLVTSFNPLRVWLAREGFARLSGEQFSLEKINDCRIHLTNMSIQLKNKPLKRNDKLGNEQPKEVNLGSKMALRDLREFLTYVHGAEVVEDVLLSIAGVIMASLQAVQSVIIPSVHSFELYGYDILLDENLKPWLLEVNASPQLAATDKADYRLKFDMIDDVLNILDFERTLTGREIRVGGFDLLWNDGPVWASSDPEADHNHHNYYNNSCCSRTSTYLPPTSVLIQRKFNIFLGAENDRVEQLKILRRKLKNS